MKKILFVLTCMILIMPFVTPADIAYIVNTNSNSIITNIINESNYSYDVIKANNIINTNFSLYRTIIIQDDVITDSNKNYIPLNSANIIFLRKETVPYIWPSAVTGATQSFNAKFEQLGTPFTEGFSDVAFNIYSSSKTVNYIRIRPSGVYKIAYSTGASTFGYSLVAFSNSTNKIVFIGFPEINFWASDTKKLFKNSLDWTLDYGIGDFDNDGFCKVGYKIQNNSIQCIFDIGSIGTDCDDNDNLTNPNGTEIPYDNIDNDCSMGDLKDVDGDNFNATISGGNDCNDNDNTIYPNNLDLTKNCVNDAPILISNISEQVLFEGETKTINLFDYFSDPEGDNLSFSISDFSENDYLSFDIIDGTAIISSISNWFGNGWVIFTASDGDKTTDSNNISLDVLHVNHAPILESIDEIEVVAGEIVKIIPQVDDSDNDVLTFSFSSPFNSSGEWQTTFQDSGDYTALVTVDDGHDGTDTKEIMIHVIPKILINEFFVSENSWVEIYNPYEEDIDLNNCKIITNSNTIILDGVLTSSGFSTFDIHNSLNKIGDVIKLKCNNNLIDEVVFGDLEEMAPIPGENQSVGRIADGTNTGNLINDFVSFDLPTKGLSNSADMIFPTINIISPANGSIFTSRDILVSFNVSDNFNSLRCDLYSDSQGEYKIINSVQVININLINNILMYAPENGNYKFNIACSDGTNNAFAESEREIKINAPVSPIFNSISDKTISENQTLEFTIIATDQNGDNVSYSADDLPQGALFSGNKFSWKPSFNQSGQYNVRFTARDISGLSNSKIIKITVNNVKLPPVFNEIPKCINKSSNIDLKINSPNNGKEAIISDVLETEFRLQNDFDKSMKIKSTAYLYDLTDEKIIDNEYYKADLKKDEQITETLNITIPESIDLNHNYALYLISESNDGVYCNSNYVEITLQREDDLLAIKKIYINPAEALNGDEIDLRVKIQNLGLDDQENVYIELKNSELGLNVKSEEFDLEKFGDEDSITKSFKFMIPNDIGAGTYEITANVIFNGLSSSASKDMIITDNTFEIINTPEINENEQTITYLEDENSSYTYLSNESFIESNSTTRTLSLDEINIESIGEIYYSYENPATIETPEKNYQVTVLKYVKDPITRNLITALDIFLVIGILFVFVKLIFAVKK